MSSSDWPPSYPPPAHHRPLRGRVLDALLDEGLGPDVDADGDVAFALRGQRLFVRCVDGDPGSSRADGEPAEAVPARLRGRVPLARVFGQWRLGDSVPDDPLVRLQAANDITARYDLVKASVHDDVLLVLVDLVVVGDAPLRPLLTGASTGVLSAVRAWYAAAGGRADGGGATP